jgi:hypothetical protein
MRSGLDLEVIFPIKDEPSARLMRLKAECLLAARVIDGSAAAAVFRRVAATAKLPARPEPTGQQ